MAWLSKQRRGKKTSFPPTCHRSHLPKEIIIEKYSLLFLFLSVDRSLVSAKLEQFCFCCSQLYPTSSDIPLTYYNCCFPSKLQKDHPKKNLSSLCLLHAQILLASGGISIFVKGVYIFKI